VGEGSGASRFQHAKTHFEVIVAKTKQLQSGRVVFGFLLALRNSFATATSVHPSVKSLPCSRSGEQGLTIHVVGASLTASSLPGWFGCGAHPCWMSSQIVRIAWPQPVPEPRIVDHVQVQSRYVPEK
jgi:hypothetical protein